MELEYDCIDVCIVHSEIGVCAIFPEVVDFRPRAFVQSILEMGEARCN